MARCTEKSVKGTYTIAGKCTITWEHPGLAGRPVQETATESIWLKGKMDTTSGSCPGCEKDFESVTKVKGRGLQIKKGPIPINVELPAAILPGLKIIDVSFDVEVSSDLEITYRSFECPA